MAGGKRIVVLAGGPRKNGVKLPGRRSTVLMGWKSAGAF